MTEQKKEQDRPMSQYVRERERGPKPTTDRGVRRRARKYAAWHDHRPYLASAFK